MNQYEHIFDSGEIHLQDSRIKCSIFRPIESTQYLRYDFLIGFQHI
jgi:hypothetical protein